uniref:Bgt-20610-3 n=1 Tax=Blumeria graminis f. sp. tritici 96224 TaxID=1268274 RepID=A0A381KZM7_BLUGR
MGHSTKHDRKENETSSVAFPSQIGVLDLEFWLWESVGAFIFFLITSYWLCSGSRSETESGTWEA